MPEPLPRVHHVVFCVHRKHQDEAAAFWADLGFTFTDIDLPDLGLRVLLDWDRGIEIISPTDSAGDESAHARRFLDEQGEGVYSIVVRTIDITEPVSIAARHGAAVAFQQHRSDENFELDEAMLHPIHGMPVTILATDLP